MLQSINIDWRKPEEIPAFSNRNESPVFTFCNHKLNRLNRLFSIFPRKFNGHSKIFIKFVFINF